VVPVAVADRVRFNRPRTLWILAAVGAAAGALAIGLSVGLTASRSQPAPALGE
jgi:uncharacterized protein (DUF2062 family)